MADFGIAALQGATALTMTGELIGSPEYIAPERIRGPSDDPASDLWSLGVVLYVCVEGTSPLRRETSLATLAAVLESEVPPPSRSGPLTPVLEALLVHDPAARPDAARLASMLGQVTAGGWVRRAVTAPQPMGAVPEFGETPPHSAHAPTVPAPHRRKRVAVSAVLALFVAVSAVFLTLRLLDENETDGDSGPAAGTRTSSTPSPAPSTAGGRWIAQLFSEPVTSGTAARDARLAKVRESVPEAELLRSDTYASLRPGYWVIHAPGPFTDGRAALAFCRERGRTAPSTCLGRYLSASAADFALQCAPPATDPTGRCTRS